MGAKLCLNIKLNPFVINKNGDLKVKDYDYSVQVDPAKAGTMKIIKDELGRWLYVRREVINKTDVVNGIMTRFYLTDEDLNKLYNFFKKIDKAKSGYLTLDEIYLLIHEKPNLSIVAPFLDRFFVMMEKEFNEKVSFEEFVPNLISYCLSSIFQLVEFVFNFYDKDHDDFVSRLDIVKFLQIKREDENLYPLNHGRAIDNFAQAVRSDKIALQEFIEICDKFPFLYYPAVHLQHLLRKYFISENFWKKYQQNVKKAYLAGMKKNENAEIKTRIEEIKHQIFEEKKKNYHGRLQVDQMIQDEKGKKIYNQDLRLDPTKFKRRKSDTDFNINNNTKTRNEKNKHRNFVAHHDNSMDDNSDTSKSSNNSEAKELNKKRKKIKKDTHSTCNDISFYKEIERYIVID